MYGSESDQVMDVDIWSSYSINGESNSTHHSGVRAGNHLLFFDSGYMPYAEYTLQIYVGYAEDDAGYSLDYIRYETTTPVATSTSQLPSLVTPTNSPTLTLASNTANASPSVALHSSQSPTMSPWTSSGQAAATASVTPGSSHSESRNLKIVLSTIGAVASLLACAFLIYKCYKRRGPYRPIDLNDEIPSEHQGEWSQTVILDHCRTHVV